MRILRVVASATIVLIGLSGRTVRAADADLAVCRAVSDGAKRLTCYDDLANKRGSAPQTSMKDAPGKWDVTETVSPVDDSKTVVAALKALEPVRDKFGGAELPTLILRCKENQTEAYINFGMFLGSESTSVLTRYDNAPASTSTWALSTDNQAAFIPGAVGAIKKMSASSKLLVQLTPYGESPVMATFDLTGAARATQGLRDACHWK